MLTTFPTKRTKEHGFTLTELLVVMLILGVLAAIAIPIFLNQQKTARDVATTTDVKNLALDVDSALIDYPDATYLGLTGGAGKVTLRVGTSAATAQATTVAMTKGTRVALVPSADGSYKIYGYNPNGKTYKGTSSVIVYDAAEGGLVGTTPKSVTTARTNLYPDGSFETSNTWSRYFTPTVARVNTEAKLGSYSLEYTTSNNTQAQGGYGTITRNWVEGEVISASGWVKAPVGMKYFFGLRSPISLGAGTPQTGYIGNGEWQEVSLTYTIPDVPQPWYAPQVITRSAFPATGTKFWIDGFTAELAEAPGGFVDGSTVGDVPTSAWVTVS